MTEESNNKNSKIESTESIQSIQVIEIIEEDKPFSPKEWANNISLKFKHSCSELISKGVKAADHLILKNYYLNLPLSIIKQSNNKNTIEIELSSNNNFKITYKQRKLAVFGLTLSSTMIYYLRSNNSRFKIRWLFPYYVFYSVLLCRENLDPFL